MVIVLLILQRYAIIGCERDTQYHKCSYVEQRKKCMTQNCTGQEFEWPEQELVPLIKQIKKSTSQRKKENEQRIVWTKQTYLPVCWGGKLELQRIYGCQHLHLDRTEPPDRLYLTMVLELTTLSMPCDIDEFPPDEIKSRTQTDQEPFMMWNKKQKLNLEAENCTQTQCKLSIF